MHSDNLKDEVTRVLDSLRPAMEADGGGVEVVSIDGGIVVVRFLGACLKCPSINLTMKYGVEPILRKHFPWIIEVVNSSAICAQSKC